VTRRVVIRADAGEDIGLGHVMRCLAIAEETTAREVETLLLVGGAVAVDVVRRRGFLVKEVERGGASLDDLRRGDLLVLDGYHFASSVVDEARERGGIVVVVDDRDTSEISADVIVAPDVVAPGRPLVGNAVVLAGPRYALVRREFTRHRRLRGDRGDGPLLVAMGGSDPSQLSGPVAGAVPRRLWPAVEVLVGPASRGRFPDGVPFDLVIDPVDVGEVLDRAGAVVSAAGSTAWELLAMGQVSALVAVAWDQRPVVDLAGRAGAALAHAGVDELAEFVEHAAHRLADPLERRSISERALDLIDGGGSARVVDTLLAL
jgi:spore coat polysaccharide biosynthesis predicted glycosyltransferase SpsG